MLSRRGLAATIHAVGTITGASFLVRAIREHGIERIFGLCGDHVNSIFNACIDESVAMALRFNAPVVVVAGNDCGWRTERALEREFKSGKVACVNVTIRGVASPLTTANAARAKAAPS